MARVKTTEKIDGVRKQMDQLANQLKALEDRHREDIRKDDFRRKVLAGGMALEYREKYPDDPFSNKLNVLIAEHVKGQKDRALFGLEPLIATLPDQSEQRKLDENKSPVQEKVSMASRLRSRSEILNPTERYK